MKQGFNDAFISYGRRESKDFATRLHDALKAKGYHVWFDQNDIPLGVDFQNQIDEGIEKADAFIFIIAPHAVKSPYCLKEIELAVRLNKQIIPILHVEPTDCWDRMHPTIQRLNWIYMREEFVENVPLDELKPLDDFEAGIQGLTELLNLHRDYVKKHTELLNLALDWERHQKNTQYLLVGKERQEAEQWLLHKFKNTQPPCRPTDLHAEFLCASKKNAENLMTDVFVSYSAQSRAIRQKIINSLAHRLITSWMHQVDIYKGEDFDEAIRKGIEQSDKVLFFISKESVKSERPLKELDYALSLNKRIIPILIEEGVSKADIPEEITNLQYIDFVDNIPEEDFGNDIDALLNEIYRDQRYFHQHKVFLNQALRWQRQAKNPSILLRGYNLQNAETWLKLGKKRKKQAPLPLHEEFIRESKTHVGTQSIEVFVSYSRKDSDFARKLEEQLTLNGKTTWFDQDSIAEGADFQQEIYKGIEQSDNFLFIISPSSVESPHCKDEVEYAVGLGKRIITVNHRFTEPDKMPPDLAAIQWIDFEKQDFITAFSLLIRTLDTDREHVQSHSKWQNRALEWDKKNKSDDLLLRGSELTLAKTWLEQVEENQKKPAPTSLQKELIAASDEHANAALIRQKRTNLILRGLLLLALIALGISIWQVVEAQRAKTKANKSADFARAEKAKADSLNLLAQKKALDLENQIQVSKRLRERADSAKVKAQRSAADALRQKNEAQKQRVAAQESAKEAELSRQKAARDAKRAAISAQKAKESETRARIKEFIAELSKEKARFNELTAISRETALKSVAAKDNDDLKPVLALVGYRAYEVARDNIQHQLETIQKQFEELDSLPPDEEKQFTEELEQTKATIETEALPPEVFGALQQAKEAVFVLNEKSFPAMWAIPFNEKGNTLFANEKGLQLLNTAEHQFPIPQKTISILDEAAPIKASCQIPDFGLITGHSNGKVYLVKSQHYTAEEVAIIPEEIHKMAYLKAQKQLAVLGVSGRLYLAPRSSRGLEKDQVQTTNITGIKALSATEEGFLLGKGNKLLLCKPASGQPEKIHELEAHERIQTLTFSEERQEIGIGTALGKVYLKPLGSQEAREMRRSHRGVVQGVCFSPDGRMFCSIGLDKQLLLWELHQGAPRLMCRLSGNQRFLSLRFSPDSQYLYYADEYKLNLMPTQPAKLYQSLQEAKPRKLSSSERELYVGDGLPQEIYQFYHE